MIRFPLDHGLLEVALEKRPDLLRVWTTVAAHYKSVVELVLSNMTVTDMSRAMVTWNTLYNRDGNGIGVPVGNGSLSDHSYIPRKVARVSPQLVLDYLNGLSDDEAHAFASEVTQRLVLIWLRRMVFFEQIANDEVMNELQLEVSAIQREVMLRWKYATFIHAFVMVFEVFVIETLIDDEQKVN